MTDTTSAAPCGSCGMPCAPGEYHPYAACLMFRACGDSAFVRANLEAVRAQPTPPAVVEPLLEQHHRDSKELRNLCAERDQARRERDVHKAEIAGLEASCSTLGKLVDELRADSERLEWVLRRCHGTWLRAYLGLVGDTGDMETLRTLIDANRGALSSTHGIKGDSHG